MYKFGVNFVGSRENNNNNNLNLKIELSELFLVANQIILRMSKQLKWFFSICTFDSY